MIRPRADRVALLVWLTLVGGSVGAGARDGAAIYRERCAACHGITGRGDGPAAAALSPPPRDFGAAAFWTARTRAEIERAVRDGRPGTMMQPFRDVLTAEEIEAVAGHVETFRAGSGEGEDAAGDHDEIPRAGAGQDATGADARP